MSSPGATRNGISHGKSSVSKKRGILLSNFPVEVMKLILRYILGSETGVLDSSTLPRARDAYGLFSNSSYLYQIFRSSFHSLYLSSEVSINGRALARLFGESLRHVRITRHVETSSFLDELSLKAPSLESLIVKFHTRDTAVGKSLVSLLYSSADTLKCLEWEGCFDEEKVDHHKIRPYLPRLNALRTRGVKAVPKKELFDLILSPGLDFACP